MIAGGSEGFGLRPQGRGGSTPSASRPTIDQVTPLATAYYHLEGNGVGGNLHVVLDDGNIGTGHIRWCREQCVQEGDQPGIELADLLLRMTMRQRHKVAARHQGYA